MRRHVYLPLFFCFVLAFSQTVQLTHAQDFDTFSFRLPSYELYAPAKIIVSFVYTNNVTTNVRTLGTSLYKITTSPVQVMFEAEAFDVYTIDILIEYTMPINQTVIIGLYEGGRAAKGIEVDVTHKRILLTIKVSVIEAPEYPSPEDIADAMWARLQAYFSEFTAQQQGLLEKIGETLIIVGSLAIISFVVCIIVLAALFYIHKRVAELSEWGIRHETEHRKGG